MSLLTCFPPRLPSLTICFCLAAFLFANFIVQVENKSFFGIGARVIGDQLLLKDVVQTPPISSAEEPVIKFQYALVEPITYLEIESDKSVHAIVNFSYSVNLVEGTISSVRHAIDTEVTKSYPFNLLIRIYGFNETMPNVDPGYILNKEQEFNGILKPSYQQDINQSLSLTDDDLKSLDDLELDYDDDAIDDDDTVDEEDIDYDENVFNNKYDKIVEQGQRQEGDFLVYETKQTSATTTELPTNHSLTFYYVDIYYITYVKFIIYEHYLYHPLNNYDNTYVVEYAHISPTTLKAIVTDHRTTSLFVQMQMYGFHPTVLPVDYKPFLSNSQTSATTSPISSLTQLKTLLNGQQSATTQQQQQNNKNGILQQQQQQQPEELDHKIPLDNASSVKCIQQVLSSLPKTGSGSQRSSPHRPISNMIAPLFVTIIISTI